MGLDARPGRWVLPRGGLLQAVLHLDGLGREVDGLIHLFHFARQQMQGGFEFEQALLGFGQRA